MNYRNILLASVFSAGLITSSVASANMLDNIFTFREDQKPSVMPDNTIPTRTIIAPYYNTEAAGDWAYYYTNPNNKPKEYMTGSSSMVMDNSKKAGTVPQYNVNNNNINNVPNNSINTPLTYNSGYQPGYKPYSYENAKLQQQVNQLQQMIMQQQQKLTSQEYTLVMQKRQIGGQEVRAAYDKRNLSNVNTGLPYSPTNNYNTQADSSNVALSATQNVANTSHPMSEANTMPKDTNKSTLTLPTSQQVDKAITDVANNSMPKEAEAMGYVKARPGDFDYKAK